MPAVRFDDVTWYRLASMAEQQGVTIAHLIESAAERLVTGTTRSRRSSRGEDLARTRAAHRAALRTEVIRLRGLGHTVAGIAAILGYSTTYVSRILCETGNRTRARTRRKQMTTRDAA